ncbi:hypothetical protein MVES1_002169 [Malassezia vespertilionis]|uniref:Major facilitator superfamily (MFS) profile domain-containing protein n=1 Tax=Malassezia vespertilionis TaxID=2020962 RepID=A0A2N1JBT0_9BASI|nr:uncharacterized protein MVES1_002169 [Malassezia vespertilionis]PKI84004.1 hypothetical protein MVES_002045 [Malassezia vespertilionis]WFD06815.1 hypothetical protein MVES1_002169 [Malassezia vespertilionis]
MGIIYNFISNIWTVHRPEFEKEQAVENDKPMAALPTKNEIVEYSNTDLKTNDEALQIGVAIAESTYAVSGWDWYFLMATLFCVYYVFSMDNQLIAASFFYVFTGGVHSQRASDYSTASAMQLAIAGVSKLVVGKVSDIYGRFAASFIPLFFYCLGCLIMAVSQNPNMLLAGDAIYAVGNGSINMIMWIILADFLSSRFRALGYGIVSLPILITFATAPKIQNNLLVLESDGVSYKDRWRWTYGMFCIMIPFVMTPMMFIMWKLERKAKRSGIIPVHPYLRKGFFYSLKQFFLDADIIGMILILGGFLMLLLALTRGADATVGWSTGWIIALLTVGGVLLVATPFWEALGAPRPFMRRRWLNSDVVLTLLLIFLDFMTFSITFQMVFAWATYTMKIDPSKQNYYTFTDTATLTVFGVVMGFLVLITKRYKPWIVFGAAVRLLAVGLMIKYRNIGTTWVQAVWPQVLLGIGGACTGEVLSIPAQVTVRHQDVAMVTAAVLLFGSLGQSIGAATYAAIMNSEYPKKIQDLVPHLTKDQGLVKYNSLATIYLNGDADASGDTYVLAFNEAAAQALYCAIGICAVMFVLTFFLRDYVLTRSQNVVSDELPEKNPFRMGSDRTYEKAITKLADTDHAPSPPEYAEPSARVVEVNYPGDNAVHQA